jgi:glycine/D-amino acid oxidase-like deaminating enzyme
LSTRCLVVGAGVVGAATAFRLAEAGADVELIDAAGPGAGTSGTTFAWVGASPLGLWDYFEINVAGMAAHRRLRAELGQADWYHSPGSLTWHSDRDAANGLVARVAELREVGYPAALISAARARELEPDLRLAPSVEQVASFPDEGYASPRPMIAELVALARQRGVRTRWNAPVVALEDGPAAVLASGERIEADAVVLCCGRWSGEVAGLAGLDIPMIAGEAGSLALGLIVLTAPAGSRLRRLLLADDLMIRPDGAGRLLLHSDAHDRRVDPNGPREQIDAIATDVIEAVFEHLEVSQIPPLADAVVGVRALTADLLPAVGWRSGTAGVYVAVTHSGVTLAPVLGELIAAEIVGGTDERLLRPFRPTRFATPPVASAAGGVMPT